MPAVHGSQPPCLHSALCCCQAWLQKCRLLLDIISEVVIMLGKPHILEKKKLIIILVSLLLSLDVRVSGFGEAEEAGAAICERSGFVQHIFQGPPHGL